MEMEKLLKLKDRLYWHSTFH